MSTSKPQNIFETPEDVRVAVITAQWNGHITSRLEESAVATLKARGLNDDDIDIYKVPGAVELTFAASQVIESETVDAVIVIGCVVRGGTPHFDYVCQSVTQGVTALNADCDVPVIFCVLTVDTEHDALERAGGSMGDKGAEAAETALAMVAFKRDVESR